MRLFESGNMEEFARTELLGLLGAQPSTGAALLSAAGGGEVTEEECLEHGWPPGCFSACTCAARCMVRLARRDEGTLMSSLLERLRTARKVEEAQPSSQDAQAQKALEKSVWRSTGMSGLSALLQATLQEEKAAAAEAAVPATESFDGVALAVNAELKEMGCCRDGRAALLGLCRNWLSYKRQEGGARDAGSRQKERQGIEYALAADPCASGCVASIYIHAIYVRLGDPDQWL